MVVRTGTGITYPATARLQAAIDKPSRPTRDQSLTKFGTSRSGVLITLILLILFGTACSSSSNPKGPPSVSITIDGAGSKIPAAVYCIDNKAKVYGNDNTADPIQVKPDKKISISVPSTIADKSWSVQIWSVVSTTGKPLPERLIGSVAAGKAKTLDKITTSDAVPDRIYLIVTIPENPKSDAAGSAGVWPVLINRDAA